MDELREAREEAERSERDREDERREDEAARRYWRDEPELSDELG